MFSKEKLYELAYLGARNKNSEFEFEDKRFNSVEKKWFTFDNEHYGASICTITEVDNARASVYVVIDNSIGNEGCDIKITRLYKEALKAYNNFENLIKSDWSTGEEDIKNESRLSNLDRCKISSSPSETLSLAYDSETNKFVFITYENVENGGFRYGIYTDLMQLLEETYEMDGSRIPYPYGFQDIEEVIDYLNEMDYELKDWVEDDLRAFALSVQH